MIKAQFRSIPLFCFLCICSNSTNESMVFLDSLCTTLEKCNSEENLFLGGYFNCLESNTDRNNVEPQLLSSK